MIHRAGRRISELEDEAMEISNSEEMKDELLKKSNQCLNELWDNIKTNIYIVEFPKKKTERGRENNG